MRATRTALTFLPQHARSERPPRDGWKPLLYSKHYKTRTGSVLTGDVNGHFVELELLADNNIDESGPMLVRARDDAPWGVEVSILESDHFSVRERVLPAIDAKFGAVGRQAALAAHKGDRAALRLLGEYLLYQLGDVPTAKIYFETAYARGDTDAIFDLAVIALFLSVRKTRVDATPIDADMKRGTT